MSKNIIQSNATVMFNIQLHAFICILAFACINCTHGYSKSVIASMQMNSTDTGKVSERMWGGGHYSTSHHTALHGVFSSDALARVLRFLPIGSYTFGLASADLSLSSLRTHCNMQWYTDAKTMGSGASSPNIAIIGDFSAPFRYARCVGRK